MASTSCKRWAPGGVARENSSIRARTSKTSLGVRATTVEIQAQLFGQLLRRFDRIDCFQKMSEQRAEIVGFEHDEMLAWTREQAASRDELHVARWQLELPSLLGSPEIGDRKRIAHSA